MASSEPEPKPARGTAWSDESGGHRSRDAGRHRDWRVHALVFDSVDVDASVRFWSGLLGLAETHRIDEYVFLEEIVDGMRLTIQAVDALAPAKSPIHVDIEPIDFDAFVARAEALGGTRVGAVRTEGYDLLVMADPCGNEFCVNERTSGAIHAPTEQVR